MKNLKNVLLALALLLAFGGTQNLSAQCWAGIMINGPTPGTCSFTVYDSSGIWGNNVVYGWDMGDGTTYTGANYGMFQHSYNANGTYIICHTISDSTIGCFATICDTLVVTCFGGGGCSAGYTYTNGPAGGVNFQANVTGNPTITYAWDFGDGNTANTANPSHQYVTGGAYQACLTITDGVGCTDTYCDSIFVAGGGLLCNAGFWATDSAFYFNFYDVSNAGGAIIAWAWDFGDGTTSTLQNPAHVYNAPGTYTVCLSIIDNLGCSDVSCMNVTVAGAGGGCGASFTHSVNPIGGGVQFAGNATGAGPFSYFWDFGDGTSSTQQNPMHSFAGNGPFNVCLTISDTNGCSDTQCQWLVLNNLPCQAGFYSYPDSAQPFTIWVVNNATGNNLTYLWDFGDGNTSTQAYPTHTYAQSGTYLLCLTIDNGAGCTDTYCDSIYATNKQNTAWTINVIQNAVVGIEPAPEPVTLESMYPNPTNGMVHLSLFAEGNERVNLTLRNVLGQVILIEEIALEAGQHMHTIQTGEAPAGIYLLSVSDPGGERATITRRLIKN